MSNLKKLAQEKRTYSFRDLTFCLDMQMNQLHDELLGTYVAALAREEDPDDKSGDQRLNVKPSTVIKKRIDKLEAEMQEKLYTLRFTAVNKGLWNSWITKNPPRKGVVLDNQLGYNVDGFFEEAAFKSILEVTDEPEGVDSKDYPTEAVDAETYKVLSEGWTAGDWDRIQTALLQLNQREGSRGFRKRGSEASPSFEPTSDSLEV